MYNLLLLAALAGSAPASTAEPAPAVKLSPSSESDLQCLTLTFVAAGTEKDEKKLSSIIAESWYFLGRLDIAAPGLDLGQATSRAFAEMSGNPKTVETGVACDAQFTKRGAALVDLGKQSEKSNW